jgi:hypothetical protein
MGLMVGWFDGWIPANQPTIKPTNGLVVTNKEDFTMKEGERAVL